MSKKISITLLFAVTFAIVGLFGNSQLWAQCGALTEAERIIESSTGERIRIVYDPCDGRFIAAYWWDGSGWDLMTGLLTCISLGVPIEGPGEDCWYWVDLVPPTGCFMEGSTSYCKRYPSKCYRR